MVLLTMGDCQADWPGAWAHTVESRMQVQALALHSLGDLELISAMQRSTRVVKSTFLQWSEAFMPAEMFDKSNSSIQRQGSCALLRALPALVALVTLFPVLCQIRIITINVRSLVGLNST